MKQKTVFYCTECGNETPRWQGQCPACGAWNTLTEAPQRPKSENKAAAAAHRARQTPEKLSELETEEEIRFSTGVGELDRVLGGGAVRGSVVLVGGAPGVGKSTLLLQLCGLIGRSERVLYVTGEESRRQLKMRAQRLGVSEGEIFVLAETQVSEILSVAEDLQPTVVIIDSIQTMFDAEVSATPGSVSQVRESTMAIMRRAKSDGFTAFVVGHINKEGAIAGPKVLEHMVDCVLYFEGEQSMSYRILRAAKNRFGSTNEIGVFEMADTGLREVPNPSESLLSGRPLDTPGTCVTCVMEGSRPILAEIQALVAQSGYGSARRNSNGIDYNRAMLLLAVLEKRGGMSVSGCDAYINVVGGLQLDEPAADLATLLAVASSFRDAPIGSDLAAVGEVGLSGEVRSVQQLNLRLSEIARLGFSRCIIPARIKGDVIQPKGLELIRVKSIREAIKAALQ
ncbi:MAG TPA: DNA repair protein RadA [Candidatus Scatomorpha merdipullorum]|uniref:DNA repair protein RadA n=1 Tax=Candidatus Scatomorpha merdipullorum TaxID=2840927 RepID=A0A9D1FC10_9FIRM|nr:DNA repair protein RadA [Candidatus Scatomorpha merdipullorum]